MSNCFEKISFIIDRHRKLNSDHVSIGVPVPHRYYKRLHFHFYSFNQNEGQSKWYTFFPDFIRQHYSFKIQTFSFILFIHDNKNIFALNGGHGSHVIKRYIDNNFGLDIVSRVIHPNNDTIHLADLRGITGNIAGRVETYREDQKILDIDSFAKVFKQLLFEISFESLENDFGIDTTSIRKKTIFVKSEDAFTIRISRSFDQFCDLIHSFIKVLGKEPNVRLGTFTPILDTSLIEKSITIKLFRTIQQRLQVREIRKDELFFFDYDFCHPTKMIDFYECDSYQIIDRSNSTCIVRTTNKNEIFSLGNL